VKKKKEKRTCWVKKIKGQQEASDVKMMNLVEVKKSVEVE